MNLVFRCKAIGVCVIFMLIYPADQISCYAGIQNRMILIGQVVTSGDGWKLITEEVKKTNPALEKLKDILE